MTTGSYWNLANPLKPVGLFDPDSTLDIPFDWADWLAQEGTGYGSHAVTADVNLRVVSTSVNGGVVSARISKAVAGTLVVGQKYSVTCTLTDDSGQVEQQTVWLKATEK